MFNKFLSEIKKEKKRIIKKGKKVTIKDIDIYT